MAVTISTALSYLSPTFLRYTSANTNSDSYSSINCFSGNIDSNSVIAFFNAATKLPVIDIYENNKFVNKEIKSIVEYKSKHLLV